jgi:hypothetical protein
MPLTKPEHRLVVLRYAYDDGITWHEAALLASRPAGGSRPGGR